MTDHTEVMRIAEGLDAVPETGADPALIQEAADALRRQSAEIERLRAELAESATDLSRVLETVKYLSGIAERGEGRKIGESETVEQFVLGYVQKLETEAVRRCEDFQEKKQ